jgi:ABC-2 type transport system permease protein
VTLQKLVPLLIILLAFGAFSREREDGTLRLVLGAGVPARTLGRAKAAGLMLPILILLVPVTIAGVLALWLGSDNGVTVPLLPRLAVTASAYLLYFGIFIALSLAVSAWAGTSRQALTILVVFWFVNCLLLPPVVIDLGHRLHPAPTALDFAASLREGKMQLPVWYEQLGSIERDLLERYGKKDVSELPISANGVAMVAEEDDYNVVQEKHYGALYAAQLSQNRFYSAAGFLAPLLALQPLSMGLAGTDFAQHADFARAAESYRREFVQMMNRDLITNEMEYRKTPLPYPGVTTKFYQPGRELWETVPPFSYNFFGTGRVFRNHWLSLAYLCGWMLASLWLAARAVSRLEVN